MAITTITFPEQADVEAHVSALVSLLSTVTHDIEATSLVALTAQCDPDTLAVQACAAALLSDMQTQGIRAPIRGAVVQLITALNVFLEGYGAATIKAPA